MKNNIFILFSILLFMFYSCENIETESCKDVVCPSHATCDLDTGSCSCNPGYKLNEQGSECLFIEDINLCESIVCEVNATCNPLDGLCYCDIGYSPDLETGLCLIDDSSLCRNVTCIDNASCEETTGECLCNQGYYSNEEGTECLPIDDSLCGDKVCPEHSTCLTTINYCLCDDGYYSNEDNTECIPIDSCQDVICQSDATCDPLDGFCYCDTGYVLDSETGLCLIDISNLCENVVCPEHATCNSETGSCSCDNGYTFNADETECIETETGPCQGVVCGSNATCSPVDGECHCDEGYLEESNECVYSACWDELEALGNDWPYKPGAAAILPYSKENLIKCSDDDEDWFKIHVNGGKRVEIDLMFTHMEGDLDIQVFRDRDNLKIASTHSTTDNAHLYFNTYQDDYYHVEVTSLGANITNYSIEMKEAPVCHSDADCEDWQECSYSLSACTLKVDRCDRFNPCLETEYCHEEAHVCLSTNPCGEDINEPNDHPALATEVNLPFTYSNLSACFENKDYFRIDLLEGQRLRVNLTNSNSAGLEFFNSRMQEVNANIEDTQTGETAYFDAQESGPIYVSVYAYVLDSSPLYDIEFLLENE